MTERLAELQNKLVAKEVALTFLQKQLEDGGTDMTDHTI